MHGRNTLFALNEARIDDVGLACIRPISSAARFAVPQST
jgi:hypothetical protein